jgi:hypothetical protein
MLVATDHLSREEAFEVREHVVIGGQPGVVRFLSPQLVRNELRLVVQLSG